MKQKFFGKLFSVLLAVMCLSVFSTNSVHAAEPVTIRYEVTCDRTSLGFVSYHNGNGPITELLAPGTTAWAYQFTTANPQQWVSVYPAPVDNPGMPAAIVSKVYINGVLYKAARGQNATTASIHVPLANLLAAGSAQQWIIRYEVAAQQTTLGFVSYSNNHNLHQVEPLAQGMTRWTYEYTTTTVDQPLKINAGPVVPYDPNQFYAVEIKVFVNDALYTTTWQTNTQSVVVEETLGNLLAKGPQQGWGTVAENTGLQIIPGYSPANHTASSPASFATNSNQPVVMINVRQMLFGEPYRPHTAGLSLYTNDQVIFLTFGTVPQVPVIEGTGNGLIALVSP